METLIKKEKKGINKVFIGGLIIGILLVAGAVYLLSLKPSMEVQKQQMLEGAYLPGSPEFEKLSKDIIFTTDAENTIESPTGLGTIMMRVPATILNKTDKTITLLEVKLGVVDRQNKMIKEKKAIVIPGLQANKLPPNEEIKIEQTLDGFSSEDDRALVKWLVTAVKTE
jgi:hypothetical protein